MYIYIIISNNSVQVLYYEGNLISKDNFPVTRLVYD